MKGDFYVPGALVLASSLRRTGNKADIICMVTTDVSQSACDMLGTLYTAVVPVNYITLHKTQTFKTKKMQDYYKDITPNILTKYACLHLEQYDKVCLLDADVIVLRNMDDIFQIQAPAGSFDNYWLQHNSVYPSDMKTGAVVPRESIERALTMKDGFVVYGSPILLPTGVDMFRRFMHYIQEAQREPRFGKSKMTIGLDEVMITKFFTINQEQDWRYITKEYACIPWKDKQTEPRLYHYVHQKPWTMKENKWSDLQPWFEEARNICANNSQASKFFKNIPSTHIHSLLHRLKNIHHKSDQHVHTDTHDTT